MEEVFVMALYSDPELLTGRPELFEIIKQWFKRFDKPIDRRTGKTGNIVKFAENKSFSTFYNETKACGFYAGKSEVGTDYEMYDWSAYANIDFGRGELLFFVNADLIKNDKAELINDMATMLLDKNIGVFYGYALTGEKMNSLGYAIGVLFYTPNDDFKAHRQLAEKVGRWEKALDEKNIKLKFRNIYPYNLFSPRHYTFKLSDSDLDKWIQTRSYGKTQQIRNDLICWYLKNEEDLEKAKAEFIGENKIWEM